MADPALPPAGSLPVIRCVPTAAEATASSAVFGGWIMAQCDHAAGAEGRRIAGPCLIRAFREVVFHAPLLPGQVFALHAAPGNRGRTSFALTLTGVAEPDSAAPRVIVTAEVVLVCIDLQGRPRPLDG